MRPAVFLDRDGTLNREVEGALEHVEQLELLPGAAAGAAQLAAAGFALVMVTNQSAVARGWTDIDSVSAINRELARRLELEGAPLAGVYVCPHHPDEGRAPYRRVCPCRKPGAGLLLRAARDLDLDLTASWLIGDARRDLAAGARAGVRTILVETGKGRAERALLTADEPAPERVVRDLAAAAAEITSR